MSVGTDTQKRFDTSVLRSAQNWSGQGVEQPAATRPALSRRQKRFLWFDRKVTFILKKQKSNVLHSVMSTALESVGT